MAKIGGQGGQGGQGGAGGVAATLVHSPSITPVAARMAAVSGNIRGSVVLDISDISAFTAITSGTLQIGTDTVTGIDLSAETTINEVVATINAAVQAVAGLATYTFSLDYINPRFYGRILRSDGDVPTIGGTLEPLFGFAPPANTVSHMAASPFITLPPPAGGGSWSHLAFDVLGQSYTGQSWYFRSDYWALGSGGVSSYLSFNNIGGWRTQSFEGAGAIVVGVAEAYNLPYFSILYDPATRRVSWREERAQPTQNTWNPSIDTLMVLGS